MKRARIFVLIIAIVSLGMLFLDLPNPVNLLYTIPAIPPITKEASPQSLPLVKPYKLGLDLSGGVRLTYDLDLSDIQSADHVSAIESTRTVIERRINVFGVSEPVIQTIKSGEDTRVIVELPSVTNVDEAINLIGRTPQLNFWEETEEYLTDIEATSSAYPLGSAIFLYDPSEQKVKKPIATKLTGADLKNASIGPTNSDGSATVLLKFSSNGGKLFADITKRNKDERVMIVLDNQVLSAPVVQNEIPNGEATITGGFTQETAMALVKELNAGALPVPLELVAQNNVGPSLGIESLKKSLIAGVIGFISVVIFMVALYKKEGILASIALVIYTIITLFIFKLLNVTLTLGGIAGFILSIGMAVDANVLIFERMKEERRALKSSKAVIEQGFKRAWTSIRDSNVSSLITTGILFYFGAPIVKGFALTLAIGILVSMFTAIVVTKNLLRVFDSNESSKLKT